MELLTPSAELYGSFLHAYEEIGVDSPDGGGFVGREAVETEGIVDFLRGAETRGSYPGWVTASNYWIVDNGEVAGMINLRHELNEALENFYGHVGYTVRPSLRRRGIARRALGGVLRRAADRGLDRVLVTCVEDNVASRRVIEANGGELEDTRVDPEGRAMRRYWIATG